MYTTDLTQVVTFLGLLAVVTFIILYFKWKFEARMQTKLEQVAESTVEGSIEFRDGLHALLKRHLGNDSKFPASERLEALDVYVSATESTEVFTIDFSRALGAVKGHIAGNHTMTVDELIERLQAVPQSERGREVWFRSLDKEFRLLSAAPELEEVEVDFDRKLPVVFLHSDEAVE